MDRMKKILIACLAVLAGTAAFAAEDDIPPAKNPPDAKEGTIEQRLQHFTWEHMKQNFTAIVDHNPTRDGLFRVTLVQTTEHGKLPLEGEIDPAGTVFFFGHFRPAGEDVKAGRLKAF